jgi:hypothetical protein
MEIEDTTNHLFKQMKLYQTTSDDDFDKVN